MGKNISGVVDFYVDAAKKLKKYVSDHHTYLEQDGAYVLAVNAVLGYLGKAPRSIILEGYMTGDPTGDGSDHLVELDGIRRAPPHRGAWLPHHFQFRIDGNKRIKAIVDSDGVKVFDVSKPRKAAKKRGTASKTKPTKKTKPAKKRKATSKLAQRRAQPKRRS